MFHYRNKMLATIAGLVILPGLLLSQSSDHGSRKGSGSFTSEDRTFLTSAARDGQNEVAMSKMALERASNPAVKAFAQRMVDDHTTANQELMALMQSKGMNTPDMASSDNNKMQTLMGLSGVDFDQTYMKQQIQDHQNDVRQFDQESQKASDPQVRAWAAKTLPILQVHLQQAQSTAGTVGVSSSRR